MPESIQPAALGLLTRPFRELWTLQWSDSQQAFHVETLMDMLSENFKAFFQVGKTGDYILLGIFETREALDKFYAYLLDQMSNQGLSNMTIDDLLK